jgi:hypothetical protein
MRPAFVGVALVFFGTQLSIASPKVEGTMKFTCRGNGMPYTMIDLPTSANQTVTFEFISMAATLDKRAENVVVRSCIRGVCEEGKATVTFKKFGNTSTIGHLLAEFSSGDRVDTDFSAKVRKKEKVECC